MGSFSRRAVCNFECFKKNIDKLESIKSKATRVRGLLSVTYAESLKGLNQHSLKKKAEMGT